MSIFLRIPKGNFKRRMKLICLAIIDVLIWFAFAQAQSMPELATIAGILADGTTYRVSKPENWNGRLILDLDGAATARGGFTQWLLDHNYAQGGTTRGNCGYNYPQCVDNLVEVRRLFAERFGTPKWTIAMGGSRGAFVARIILPRRNYEHIWRNIDR